MSDAAVKLAWNAWDARSKYCLLGSLRVVIQSYLWFDFAVMLHQVLEQQSEDLASQKKK